MSDPKHCSATSIPVVVASSTPNKAGSAAFVTVRAGTLFAKRTVSAARAFAASAFGSASQSWHCVAVFWTIASGNSPALERYTKASANADAVAVKADAVKARKKKTDSQSNFNFPFTYQFIIAFSYL